MRKITQMLNLMKVVKVDDVEREIESMEALRRITDHDGNYMMV